MSPSPASLARVRLDKVRQGYSQFDFSFGQTLQFSTRPWQIMQMHVASLDYPIRSPPEWLEGILHNESRIVQTTIDCTLKVRYPIPIATEQCQFFNASWWLR